MIKDSKICTFAISAIKWLFRSFTESKLYAMLLAVVNFFAVGYANSGVRRFLIGKHEIEEYASDSVFYRVICKISSAVIGFFAGIAGKLYEYSTGSIVNKIYRSIFKRSYSEMYLYFVAFVSSFIFVIPHNFWSNTFGMLFAALLFGLYIIALAGKDESLVPGKNANKLWFSMLVFGISLVLSCFVSYDSGDSIRVLLFFITSFMLCFVIYASVKNENGLDTICGFMYGALMITSAIAVVQRVLGVEADASLTDLNLNEEMPGRVFSTLGNPNNFAEFLVLFMPFAFAFALNKKKATGKSTYVAGMLLPLVAILLTYSRSGWIALAIAVAIFVALYDKKLIPVFIVVGILAIPFIPQNILNRILTIGNLEDTSSSYRVDIWTGCLDMLKDYWFTGVGLGTGGFAEIYPAYGVGESYVAPHSHMHFMEMLCELGVLGFVSYVCMTFTLIKRSFVAASNKVPSAVRNYAIASAASMTGIVLIGCFEYCWFYPRVMFAFFVCAGVGMAAYKCAKQTKGV